MNQLMLKPAGYRGPLRLTSASKVREWPEQANAFSLPTIREVCVYATSTCWRGCYAKRGRMIFPTPQRAFRRNYDALVKASTAEQMAELLIDLFDWMKFSVVRIHVSGEFFSVEYARAWVLTCGEFSRAIFWSYTRSQDMEVLSTLAEAPNLRILLSCDRDNWQQILDISQGFPGFGLSYYSVGESPTDSLYERGDKVPDDNPIGLVVFPDQSVQRRLNLPGTCPTEVSVNPWPKEGACVKCMRCCGYSI